MSFELHKPVIRRLSLRLTLWHSLLFLGSALGLLGLTYVLLRNRAQATEHYVIESRLNQYVSEYNRIGLEGVQHLAILRRGRAQQAFFVRVGDAQNKTVFLRYAEDWSEFAPEQLAGQAVPATGARSWQILPSPDGTTLQIGTQTLPDGFVVQVGKANEELRDLLSAYRRTALLVLLIFVPASFAGGAFVTSRALRPIQQLTDVVQGIVETNRFDDRVPSPGSRDELDALVQLFNRMLSRIDTLVRGMRDSIDNVAHDLRTPLTRLRHKAQAAIESGGESATPSCANCQNAQSALADCVEESERVSAILDTLMDIAEAETGLVKLEMSELDITKLLEDVVEAYNEFAADRRILVSLDLTGSLLVHGDATALFRVFANILDNALKYTPPDGRIQVTAQMTGGSVDVNFADTGMGIPTEDLHRVWERLFRSDRSRSARGLGLGLSFVRAIVEAHGGESLIRSKQGEGTVVTIKLPLAAATARPASADAESAASTTLR